MGLSHTEVFLVYSSNFRAKSFQNWFVHYQSVICIALSLITSFFRLHLLECVSVVCVKAKISEFIFDGLSVFLCRSLFLTVVEDFVQGWWRLSKRLLLLFLSNSLFNRHELSRFTHISDLSHSPIRSERLVQTLACFALVESIDVEADDAIYELLSNFLWNSLNRARHLPIAFLIEKHDYVVFIAKSFWNIRSILRYQITLEQVRFVFAPHVRVDELYTGTPH